MGKRSGITICNNNWIRVFLVFRFIYLLIFFSIFVVGFCVLVVVDFFNLYKFKEFFNDAHIKSNVKEIFLKNQTFKKRESPFYMSLFQIA